MRRHTTRALLATVAAGASALLIIGVSAASSAQPTTARPDIGTSAIVTSSQAGYVTLGQHFRFVTTNVVVPPKASYSHYAEVVLGGRGVIPATLGVAAGGGARSVRWNVLGPLTDKMAGGTMPVSPKVGDRVTLSIYFNQKKGRVYFTVADLTQNYTKILAAPAPAHVVYTAAEVACLLPSAPSVPKADIQLWEFGKSGATTYSGIRGTMLNPMWTTRKIIDVAADGHVVMSPWFLWNGGHNFGAWLRAAS
jgi:hypothetical protein